MYKRQPTPGPDPPDNSPTPGHDPVAAQQSPSHELFDTLSSAGTPRRSAPRSLSPPPHREAPFWGDLTAAPLSPTASTPWRRDAAANPAYQHHDLPYAPPKPTRPSNPGAGLCNEHDERRASSGTDSLRNTCVAGVRRMSDGAAVRRASDGTDSLQLVSTALSDNPLFASIGLQPAATAAAAPLPQLPDNALACIFSHLLDADFPGAVCAGEVPPARRDRIVAQCLQLSPTAAPAALAALPFDGRGTGGARALLTAQLVCKRWLGIVRGRVVRHLAAFGAAAPPEAPHTDPERADREEEDAVVAEVPPLRVESVLLVLPPGRPAALRLASLGAPPCHRAPSCSLPNFAGYSVLKREHPSYQGRSPAGAQQALCGTIAALPAAQQERETK